MNDCIEYLVNLAFTRGISAVLTKELSPDTPSCANAKRRIVVINMNWNRQEEIPFTIAHILNEDNGVRYYSSNTVRTKTEAAANQTALDLLLDYCNAYDIPVPNSVVFCEQFGIPTELEYIAFLKIKRILIS